MQAQPIDETTSSNPTEATETQTSAIQDGFQQHVTSLPDDRPRTSSRRSSFAAAARSLTSESNSWVFGGSADTPRRLSGEDERATLPGERITAYENAATPDMSQTVGFKVVKRSGPPSDGPSLADCPNGMSLSSLWIIDKAADHVSEILTQILSHLHPESHGMVALVSKRFYALMTEPHAWRMAFLRYFPGHESLIHSHRKAVEDRNSNEHANRVRSESRYFTRLTSLASWRSEYLLRTRLLRSIARGKPGASSRGTGESSRASHSNKKSSAVLTYNSKLPWIARHVHAVFDNNKKGPKAIVGTADLCVSTVSDPSTGKVEKWGLDDPFAFAQLDEVFPNLEPFGLGDGPAAVYNVMDLSQPYGMIGGEGFPGGRPYYRATNEVRGRYLGGSDSSIIDMSPEVPKIPELMESICSVWIAKSSAVPSMTQNMVGMMTGSSLGVVTTYSLGHDTKGPRYKSGEMTARWVLSPGVPIISLDVDESYNFKRKALGRVWAVALNALGECFVLTSTPTPPAEPLRKDMEVNKAAWLAGRSVYWELIESTRRQARPDDLDKNAVRGAYSPRSPCDVMGLSKQQIIAEAREIEKFLRYEPAHFRKVCEGWDMQRKMEIDFAEEIIVVFRCIQQKDSPAEVLRYSRSNIYDNRTPRGDKAGFASQSPTPASLASGAQTPATAGIGSPNTLSLDSLEAGYLHRELPAEWQTSRLCVKKLGHAEITATAIDSSLHALLAPFEDPLNSDAQSLRSGSGTPISKQSSGELPGRRARLIGIGTDHGKIIVWNVRDSSLGVVEPVFAVQTESPEVTSLAITALHLVHGGSDGLVQAWDPLASSLAPIRTLSSKSSGRAPRHIVNANPVLRHADYSACSTILLDPNPTSLRGILCFGTFVRYWSYSSAAQSVGRKRRLRHSDIHGRLASRRQGDAVLGYIAAEEAELRREQEHRSRENARLRNRFGVGLGDLTEDESIRYAQMISEEAFMLDEQRRTSASDNGSAADVGETNSTSGSLDTVTPDPSLSGQSLSVSASPAVVSNVPANDDDFEQQIQRALRLSLMEGAGDMGHSPRANSSTDFEFHVKYKPQKNKPTASASQNYGRASTDQRQGGQSIRQSSDWDAPRQAEEDIDEDLALALRLSLEEEELHKQSQAAGLGIDDDGFPPLDPNDKGKGVARW